MVAMGIGIVCITYKAIRKKKEDVGSSELSVRAPEETEHLRA